MEQSGQAGLPHQVPVHLSRWDRGADAVVTWIEWRQRNAERTDQPGVTYPLAGFPARRAVLQTRQPLAVRVGD